MVIALDYDDTYTRDPRFWDGVILDAYAKGHTVICATLRFESEGKEVLRALEGKVKDIIFTGRKAKREAVRAAGYEPNVWIDDMPFFIDNDALPKAA